MILAALFFICNFCAAQGRNTVTVKPYIDSSTQNTPSAVVIVDGKLIEVQSAQMFRGQQIMVWLRDLEKLGWGTIELGNSGQTIFKGKNTTLTFSNGNGVALVNSLPVKLPINTYMYRSRLMVPLSFVAKALGYNYSSGYKPIAVVTTTTTKAAKKADNTIEGKLLYNDRGAGGVVVRVVDSNYNLINDAIAKTDAEGNYKISGLPDGDYMAYVYINDNPSYSNRVSETVSVSSGATIKLKPVILGKIIAPKEPACEKAVSPVDGRIDFTWAKCEGAVSYAISITDTNGRLIVETKSPQPNTAISESRFKSGQKYVVEIKAYNAKGEYLGATAGAGGKPWVFSVEK